MKDSSLDLSFDYHELMSKRIKKILLICSSYDHYTLEEDGRLDVQINREYLELNLSNPPAFISVNTAVEALETLESQQGFDLIISMLNVGEVDVFDFSRRVKQSYGDIPIVLMANFSNDTQRRLDTEDHSAIDYVFCWHGNADLIIAIIKIIEDRMNADSDILVGGVQSILLVEDSVRYYSTYLPAIYKLVLQQSSEFLKEALNEGQQKLRKRARPKILFATNYSEAVELYQRYKKNLLGVISDVGFVVNKNDPSDTEKLDAGIHLCKLIKADNKHMPFLLQSSQESIREVARELGVGFIAKYSKTLLLELSEYISREFKFGDFIFKHPETGAIIGRAKDLRELQELVTTIPEEILISTTSHNDFSRWLYSRGLFSLATSMKDVNNAEFSSTQEMRDFIVNTIAEYRTFLGQGVVAKFDAQTYSQYIWFSRLGEGSIGGKARGLAFINNMLIKHGFFDKYPGIKVMIPRTAVIATDYFDQFLQENGLQYILNSDISDEEILSEFVSSRLPQKLVDELRVYIAGIQWPLAIRSSSKLEDSQYQPFAGIYSTYMVPITDQKDQTLRLIGKAIKSVYASTFFAASRAYIQATGNLLSEEKMGVIIQEVCGTQDQGVYFPTISGVARSINYYPIGDEKPEDGIASIALGLGKLVVEGGQCLRFSPKFPKNILQLSTPELTLRDTQREFWALDLRPNEFRTSTNDAINYKRIEVGRAKDFRNLKHVCSVWDMRNQRISDSSFDTGRNLVTFSRILKYDTMPLASILSDLLAMGEKEMQCHVEIEFAVNMDVPYGRDKIFNFLQIRPIFANSDSHVLDWSEVDTSDALIYSENALGLGAINDVCDIIYVRNENFDSAHTVEMTQEISKLNALMGEQGRGYILVGPGRWGSSDSWLGLPVRWNDISQAKGIVECGLEDFRIEPSQGTHFFQNITSLGVGYMTISPFMGDGIFDTKTLDAIPAIYESKHIRHVRFENPLYVFVDGRGGKGIIKLK